MSGRKTFTAGEVLQAADVNDYLMDQSVMVFAGTAARGSAIPSPTEGMVTYRSDDNVVEVYDGSSFVPVGPGQILDVVSVTKTDTFSASVAGGGNTPVTDLTITHSLQNASNKLFITAFFGKSASSHGRGNAGILITDDGTAILIGDAASNRLRLTAGGQVTENTGANQAVAMPHISALYAPGDTASHTYRVAVVNHDGSTRTLYVNRDELDPNNTGLGGRTISTLTLMEVAG